MDSTVRETTGHTAESVNGAALREARVSVAMPVYNGSRYLRETLDSVLAQSMSDWQLVIVDDFSTDESWEIISEYAARDPRIRAERFPENRGHRAASNRAFEMAVGTYVARTDQDDLMLPGRLAAQVRHLDAHPEIGLVASAYYRQTPEGRLLLRRPKSNPIRVRWGLMFDNKFCHSTLMFRRELVSGASPYRYAPAAYDYEICARLAQVTGVTSLDEPLVIYRVHDAGLTATGGHEMRSSALAISFLQIRSMMSPRRLNRAELCAIRRIVMGRRPSREDVVFLPLVIELLDRFAAVTGATATDLAPIRLRVFRRLLRNVPLRRLLPLLRSDASDVFLAAFGNLGRTAHGAARNLKYRFGG